MLYILKLLTYGIVIYIIFSVCVLLIIYKGYFLKRGHGDVTYILLLLGNQLGEILPQCNLIPNCKWSTILYLKKDLIR